MFKKESKLRPKVVIDEEIQNKSELDEGLISVCKTDTSGVIKYVNDTFTEFSGYSKVEIMGEPLFLMRHSDTPCTIINHLWKALQEERNFHAVLKILAKDGRYYWIVTDYTIDKDDSGIVKGYTSRRRLAPKSVVKVFKPVYRDLVSIEKVKGQEFAEKYFRSYLEEEVEDKYDDILDTYAHFVIDLFEAGLEAEVLKSRRKKVSRTLDWFFSSEYAENVGVSKGLTFF